MMITEPEQWICENYHKHQNDIRVFAVTVLAGMLIHFYALANKFFNYFEMGNILSDMDYHQNDTLGLGRWFLPVATNLFTSFSVPAVNGVICLSYMGLSAVLITKLLGMQKTVYRILFGMVWVAFPGMACVFSFGVNSDALCLSILLTVLAAYATERWKHGGIYGSLLLCLGLGAYQPYMSVAIGLFYCLLLLQLLQKKLAVKEYAIRIIKYAAVLAAGFTLYYLILQLCVSAADVTVSSYHGVNEMTSFTLKGILKGLVYSYGYFLAYFFSTGYTYTAGNVIVNIAALIVFSYFLWRISRKFAAGQRWCILILTALLPLGLESAPFLMADRVGNGVDRYMIFSTMLVWVLLLRCLELEKAQDNGNSKHPAVMKWIAVTAALVTVLTGYVICNESYHRTEAMTEATTSYITRMAARIEAVPEWREGGSVYFVNPRNLLNDAYRVSIPKYDRIENMPGTEFSASYSEKAIVNYLEVYLHFPVNTVSKEKKETLDASQTVQEMPAFPAADSIQVVDGVIVVKVSEREK